MIKVLICGSISDTGGVSTHTKQLAHHLTNQGVLVDLYRFQSKLGKPIIIRNCEKIFQRTVGLLYYAFKKRKEYQILHIQTSGGLGSFISGITGVIAAKILKKPLIVTFHFSGTKEFIERHKHLFKFVLMNSSRFILVSYKQMESIKKHFPEGTDHLENIPNGFDENIYYYRDKYECRKLLDIPLESKILFNISNLIKSKGHRYLIEAIHRIDDPDNTFQCFIAGKGNQFEQLKTRIYHNHLEKKIMLLGWIPDEQIPIWMNACDFFVMPSCAEGNPIVMFESIACGKPYIGTNVGGVPEIINSDEYGLLVEPGNIKDLAEKIMLALNREWNQEAILTYAQQFTWKNIARKTLDVYEQILI